MQAISTAKPRGKGTGRSKVTNGSAVVQDADGRSVWMRRLRDLIANHEDDLGGTDKINQAQRSIVRRAATLSVELERMEAKFAQVGSISSEELDAYQRASNTLRRHLEHLGLREQRPIPAEVARTIEGARICNTVVDGFGLAEHAVGVGRDQAMINVARRIAFAVARAKETGEPIPESIASLAVELRMADWADDAAHVAQDNVEQDNKGLL